MKATKRLFAMLLALIMLCVGVPFAFAEGEEEYQVGDQIQFGTYPQTRVDETPELKAAAESAIWKSYDYYSGTGLSDDGNMQPGNYMQFADFFCDGEKYRAVTFSAYRPYYTGYQSNTAYTRQYGNGYIINTLYYFRYEPLKWRILDPIAGLVLSENVIDAQVYQNTVYYEWGGDYWQDESLNVYACDYACSSIRTWLNYDFLETAFSEKQKKNIQVASIDNAALYGVQRYSSVETEDRIFLLSNAEASNNSFGFNVSSAMDTQRLSKGTDYAKCQGLSCVINSSYSNYGDASWLLRTASDKCGYICNVHLRGNIEHGMAGKSNEISNVEGVRPACYLKNLLVDTTQSDTLFSSIKHKHIFSDTKREKVVNSTCTKGGQYEAVTYCSSCGTELSRVLEKTGALNHNAGEKQIENEAAATCTQKGSYEQVIYCTECGVEMTRETIALYPLGHIETTYSQASTCTENGFTITICTRCGETLSKEILPRLDHNWTSEVTQNPTCTAQGVKTYTCESCGETYTEPVDVLAHEWDDGKMTKAPSCTEAGEMTYTCATGGETRTEPIDKLDHEIELVAGKAASCTEPGLTDGWQCKMCKKWFAEQQTIPALDHDPQIGKVVEPTCTDPGYTPFICTRCGETVSKTDPTDALGHDMQPTYVWAKDDSTVTATMVCTRCDKTGATETAKVKTEITVKPTCSTEGELTLIAAFNNKSFYGQSKTKTLPRDPDAHVFKVTVTPPTCLDDGYTTHACALCRYGYSDEIVPALGHDYQHHDAKAPTCEAPGWDAYDTCSRCDYTTYSERATVDHDDADNDGKCDMCGDQMRGGSHCKYCGKIHGGAFGWLTKLIHSILAVFKR